MRYLSKIHLPGNLIMFRDLSTYSPEKRYAKSKIIQFYSAVRNIGNYLPTKAIQILLGCETDTWNMHDKNIDFEYVNKNYQVAIIGGAGLMYNCFTDFWKRFANECKLEYIIWGVGGCYPDDEIYPNVPVKIIRNTFDRLRLVNVRDDLTANFYGFNNPDITVCPSVYFLQEYVVPNFKSDGKIILFSNHEQLVQKEDAIKILNIITQFRQSVIYTNNIQSSPEMFKELLDLYSRSKLVVTTRLHGAVIAYALGIPYIAIPRDNKLREFVRLYG
ncbi:MAG: polysaccharide pyruvyl transferase family protein, partial [Cyclobacteriaceae bacterium]|nr:polysaccharide pyruvyl transferase family protein [Cyclobacteriaceae bacterium]